MKNGTQFARKLSPTPLLARPCSIFHGTNMPAKGLGSMKGGLLVQQMWSPTINRNALHISCNCVAYLRGFYVEHNAPGKEHTHSSTSQLKVQSASLPV